MASLRELRKEVYETERSWRVHGRNADRALRQYNRALTLYFGARQQQVCHCNRRNSLRNYQRLHQV